MAKVKDTPNLPGSSRMQMPSTGDKLNGLTSEHGGMAKGKASGVVKAGGVASLVSKAKGKAGMKGSNPYC